MRLACYIKINMMISERNFFLFLFSVWWMKTKVFLYGVYTHTSDEENRSVKQKNTHHHKKDEMELCIIIVLKMLWFYIFLTKMYMCSVSNKFMSNICVEFEFIHRWNECPLPFCCPVFSSFFIVFSYFKNWEKKHSHEFSLARDNFS